MGSSKPLRNANKNDGGNPEIPSGEGYKCSFGRYRNWSLATPLMGHLACSIHQYLIARMEEGKRRIITPLVVEEIKNYGESVDRKLGRHADVIISK